MITMRMWRDKGVMRGGKPTSIMRQGWFLFGFIPLLICDVTAQI